MNYPWKRNDTNSTSYYAWMRTVLPCADVGTSIESVRWFYKMCFRNASFRNMIKIFKYILYSRKTYVQTYVQNRSAYFHTMKKYLSDICEVKLYVNFQDHYRSKLYNSGKSTCEFYVKPDLLYIYCTQRCRSSSLCLLIFKSNNCTYGFSL